MRILCLGDVVGAPGRNVIRKRLPEFRERESIDLVIANIENIVDGSGVNGSSFRVVRAAGVDVCTTGDHVYRRADVLKVFENEPERLLRPINYPEKAAGRGLTVVEAGDGVPVAVINVQGRVFMDPADDPFAAVTRALEGLDAPVVVVDFHAEATSEKRAMGFFLDGRVAACVGTHTHVPTADEEILPEGTAYVSDLGMSGPYRSVIGRRADRVLYSMTTRMYAPFDLATEDVRSTGVLIDVDPERGTATAIRRITLWLEDRPEA